SSGRARRRRSPRPDADHDWPHAREWVGARTHGQSGRVRVSPHAGHRGAGLAHARASALADRRGRAGGDGWTRLGAVAQAAVWRTIQPARLSHAMTSRWPHARTRDGATALPCPRGKDTTTHAHGNGAAGIDEATSLDA